MSFRVKLRLKSFKGILQPIPVLPGLWVPPAVPNDCSKCGLRFVDALGRPVVMGYACGHADCPTSFGRRSGSSASSVRDTMLWNGAVQ